MALQSVSRRTVAGIAVVAATATLGLLAAPSLPERMVTHWNAAGTPDDTLPRSVVLVAGPALVLGVVALFEVIPRIDPLGENVASFQAAYDATAVLVTAFLAYVYAVVLAWNLGYEFPVVQAMVPAVAVLYVAMGYLLERAERNWFVGIRTPWTLSSAAVWRHTHDRTAVLFKLAGVVALGGLVVPDYAVYFVAGPAAVAALFGTVYSYVEYRRVEETETPTS